jgi:hypothetical protein
MMTKVMTALAVLGFAGCATTAPVPPYQLDRTLASIRGAEEIGALGVPAAALHLQLAKDETEEAQKMATSGDQRSVLVMARAQSDAELALGLAREVKVHGDALRAGEELKAVRARGNP